MVVDGQIVRRFVRVSRRADGRNRWDKYAAYLCIDCHRETWALISSLRNLTGRCRTCANHIKSKHKSIRNRRRPYEWLLNSLINSCSKINRPISLTYEQFALLMQDNICCYCGSIVRRSEYIKHTRGAKRGTGDYAHHLDRKDSSLGYSFDNCVTACWPCNKVKTNVLTHDEMRAAMAAVVAMRKADACS